MAGQDKYTTEQVITALRETKGLVSLAARRLGCVDQTVHNYAVRYASVRAVQQEQRDQLVDLAEGKLIQAVTNGEPWAIALVLKTLGKKRGYVERHETEHRGVIGTYTIDIGGDGSHDQ